jgi:hypothetical protein
LPLNQTEPYLESMADNSGENLFFFLYELILKAMQKLI